MFLFLEFVNIENILFCDFMAKSEKSTAEQHENRGG
jgi:hypothetical protein